ncbi:uncharacterized protein [Ptychodera flava]|uniref:uncharacterized protein n=1 Tax=Ptychodera flava TaxID=63121 RepID=UPI00396A252D
MKAFVQKKTVINQVSMDNISEFSWKKFIGETRAGLPTLHSVIEGALTLQRSEDKVEISTDDGKMGPLVPGLGFLIGTILNLRHKFKFKYLQGLNSIQMYIGGCSQNIFRWFSKLGICCGEKTTRRLLDKLRKEFDSEIKKWQSNIQSEISQKSSDKDCVRANSRLVNNSERSCSSDSDSESEDELDESEATQAETDSDGSCRDSGSANGEETESGSMLSPGQVRQYEDLGVNVLVDDKTEKEPGFALCWDNVQKFSTARHQSQKSRNKMMMWALSYAVRNRVSGRHLENIDQTIKANHLPLSAFLPTKTDWKSLEERMVTIVERIMVKRFNCFETEEKGVTWHISHEFSKESVRKSEIVNLGVIQENPSSGKGVYAIMRRLCSYVPLKDDGNPWPIVCHGDQLSVERMLECQASVAASEHLSDRLLGLVPRPQEFHKQCIILQDTMDKLFTGKSLADPGTLFHIKTRFGHRSVKKKVIDNVNHVVDFLNFTTEGMVCLLVMKLCRLNSLSDSLSENYPDVSTVLKETAKQIVQYIWPNMDAVYDLELPDTSFVEDAEFEYCFCKGEAEDISGILIECSAGSECRNGIWFHTECVNVEPDDIPEDQWYCSDTCSKTSPYCCKIAKDVELIGCESRQHCFRGEWFHLDCVGLNTIPDGKWYCSTDCRESCIDKELGDGEEDNVFNYSCAMTYRGLLHMAEKDAERENDGQSMISHWKIDMLDFWSNNHFKYLTLGHRLLACKCFTGNLQTQLLTRVRKKCK